MSKNFRLGELFCGPGGIALGARLSKFKYGNDFYRITPAWASDYDKATCETFARNIHGHSLSDASDCVFHSDVRELNISGLPECDGLAFGFPCNDFSIVGESKGLNGKFGPLYSYGVKYLREHQPDWFVAENVGGLSSSDEGKAFERITGELDDAGYNLTANLYKFEDYGVPQARHRLIIVGLRKDLNLSFRVPAPTHKGAHVTSYDAITNPVISAKLHNHDFTSQSKGVVERLKYIKPGHNAWSEEIPKHLRLNVKGAKLSNIYKRLDPMKPSYTVTGSGGGGTHMYHWEEHRALTNRERARLQTFPDDFVFFGGKESVRRQIGMAVPPMGAKVIFDAILKTFAQQSYDFVEPSKPLRFHKQLDLLSK
ncbi:DNA cytosine methyltransferase [bacterium]|jgi:DNA (cytosine-5)-methyltransferase 1|nr:DNA cytosine methyltransferase [bacterium]